MKKLWIVLAILCICGLTGADEGTLQFDNATDSYMIDFEASNLTTTASIEWTCAYAVYAEDREALLNCFSDEVYPLICNFNEYSEIYETKEDIPYGNVYLMNGRWLIYYENNHGYMPIWKEMEDEESNSSSIDAIDAVSM